MPEEPKYETRWLIYHAGIKKYFRGSRGKAGRGSAIRWTEAFKAQYFASKEIAERIALRFHGVEILSNDELYEKGVEVKFFQIVEEN